MTAVLITGGTGFVGGHLRQALGEQAVVLMGRREPSLQSNERWSHLDLSKPVEPETRLSGEVLCHLAYSVQAGTANIKQNERLLHIVNDSPSVSRVVLLSSTSVYGEGITEGIVDEDTPCDPSGVYAETKLECEMLWREKLRRDCYLIVLRPSEIIGPGGKGLLPIVSDALERTLSGTIKRTMLYHRRLHFVAVSNVVAAIKFALERPHSAPTDKDLYVVSDDHQPENESYAAMQDAVREVLGRRPLPGVAMPQPLLWTLGRAIGRPISSGHIYSSQKLQSAGFVSAVPLSYEIRRVVQGLRDTKGSPGYD